MEPKSLSEPVSDWPEWICPHDASPLVPGDRESLQCDLGHSFPSHSGVFRFVPTESYAAAFGAQWNRYKRVQLDSYAGIGVSRDRLRRCLGEDLWDSLAGRHVLECGCGAGRFTEVLLERDARITSIDLSSAVDANAANFPPDGHHRVAQADILNLPFKRRVYDVVLALGVIQHTPCPEVTISALFDQVRPGGWLVIDHYTHTFGRYLRPGQLPHIVLRRLPPGRSLAVTEKMVDVLLPLHQRVGRGSPWKSKVLLRFSPVNSYYHRYPSLSESTQREWALLDTHDHLTDRYKRLRSRRRLHSVLQGLGLETIWCERGGNGVEARGRRALS